MQSRASERLQDQIKEEIKEMKHTKTEEASQLVRKEHDLWMYQNEKEEARRLQGARKPEKDVEMAWVPPRNRSKWPDWEEARKKRKKASGGWSLKGKRKCRKSLSCRMRWKALSWTWRAKSRREQVSRKKQSSLEEKEKHQTKRVRRLKKSKKGK